ncbi:MAG TPA: MarR family winged helix-turn-helix transcriptional regulator [Rhizomicrobium sp.]|nr:MarR family winged helix-turn-helix transcriptional regulator [Rhizomicrobium sp.]
MRELHRAMLDIAGFLNRPQRDAVLIKEAGISLDRALFPLLSGIERFGPIGVVDLADRAGRDHTTVSRQIAKLVDLGLIARRASAADRRIHECVITAKGKTLTDALDAARRRLATPILAKWSEKDFADLVRLMRKLADDLIALPDE